MTDDIAPDLPDPAGPGHSEHRYRALFENLEAGFCVIEMIFDERGRPIDYRFLETNPAFEKYSGLVNVIGKRMREISPNHEARWFEAYGDVALTGRPARLRDRVERLDRWFDVHAFRFGAPETPQVAVLFSDVSAMVRAQEELQATEELFRTTFEQAGVGIAHVALDGRWLRVNRKLCDIVGYSREELMRLSFQAITHPEDLAPDLAYVQRLLAGELDEYRMEKRYLHKDGRVVWIELTGALVRDEEKRPQYFISVIEDIRRRKENEEALRASEERFTKAFHASPDGLVISRVSDGTIIDCNQSFLDLTELQRDSAIGKRSVDLGLFDDPDDRERALAILRAQGQLRDYEVRVRSRSGVLRTAHISVEQLNIAGEALLLTIIRDFTDRKRAEHEMRLLNEQLLEADRRKDEFIAVLAHELRNPLAPIRNALDLIKLRPGDLATVDHGRAIAHRQVEYLVRLVDDLLDVSRISRGLITLKREAATLQSIMETALETARPAIDAAGQTLFLDLPELPLPLYVDPTRLAQVTANLLVNAAKFTRRGGNIRLIAQAEPDEVVIRVEDDGIGIDSELLPRLFEPFSQGGQLGARAQGGLGIGLALVKSIVEMHGGHVDAASDGPDQGSTFTIRLPVAPNSSSGVAAEPTTADTAVSRQAGRRILVVDDNVDVADSLAAVLSALGHKASAVYSGSHALEEAARLEPDFILLDIGMPGMNGYQVADELRRRPAEKRPLLVAITGFGQQKDLDRTREAGFDHHLVKPVALNALQQVLQAG
jgi:PAS domain S-box-containing protein